MLGAFLLVTFGFLAAETEQPPEPVDLLVHVVDEAGQPAPFAQVHCVMLPEKKVPRLEPIQPRERGLTDLHGKCTFSGLTGKTYMVRAFKGQMNACRFVVPGYPETTEEPFNPRLASPYRPCRPPC